MVTVLAAPRVLPTPRAKKELTDYEKGLIWKMYEIFRGPDEEARLRKVAELTAWDLMTVRTVVAEGPRPWVAVPPIIPAKPEERVKVGEEVLTPEVPPEEMALDLGALTLEELESLKREIDEELRRRGYLRS